jgi:N-acetylmuramoyl-L-alanine amidase
MQERREKLKEKGKRIYGTLLILLLLLFCRITPLPAQTVFSIKTVVIDAGHGGKDPGAIGLGKTYEKDVALAVALLLGEQIQKNHPQIKVIYTRKTDVFIPLYDRANIANKAKADLFISIHLNSSTNREVFGSSTYVLGLHRSEDNLEVAKRENAVIEYESADDRQNYDFDPNSAEGHIIMSMKQNAFLDQSITMASHLEDHYEEHARRTSRGVKQAGFYVLYKTSMPALLTEIGFISNPNEERFLASDEGKRFISQSVYKAFLDYKNEIELSKKPTSAAVKTNTAAADQIQSPPPPAEPKLNTAVVPQKQIISEPIKPSSQVELKQGKIPSAATAENKVSSKEAAHSGSKPLDGLSKSDVNTQKPVRENPVLITPGNEARLFKKEAPVKATVSLKENKPLPTDSNSKKSAIMSNPVLAETKSSEPKIAQADTVRAVKPSVALVPNLAENSLKSEVKKDAITPVVKAETEKPGVDSPMVKKVTADIQKAEAKKIDKAEELVFRIQLIALGKAPANLEAIREAFPGLMTEPSGTGLMRYLSGPCKSIKEAEALIPLALKFGFKGAFVVAYRNGVRLDPSPLKGISVKP